MTERTLSEDPLPHAGTSRQRLLALLLLLPLLALACGPRSAARTRNIVIISIDTLRADRLGCYGHTSARTPAIDALAAGGVRFARALTPVPLTTPAHASLFTGLEPCAHGVRDNVEFRLPDAARTLAEELGERGFRTAAFVSSFGLDSGYGLDQGFAVYDDDMQERVERSCDVTNLAAFAWLAEGGEARSEAPFFLFVHYFEPHRPYQPPKPLVRGADTSSLYDAEVAHADACVGNLLRFLAERGQRDDSLVVLVADHGEALGEHGEHGHGNFLYDTTLHIPFLMAGPGFAVGHVEPAAVSLVDVMPTVLEALGLEAPGTGIQGRSLLQAARGRGLAEAPVYAETVHPRLAHGLSQLKALSRGAKKLILGPDPELFDVVADPAESRNLASDDPETLASHREALVAALGGCRESALDVTLAAPSEEAREKLLALGYVGASGDAASQLDDELDFSGPDPKSRAVELAKFEEAIWAADARRFAEAGQLLQAVVSRDPENAMALQMLGVVLMQDGRYAEAAPLLERARERAPRSFDVLYSLALAYRQLRRPAEALEVLSVLQAAHPGRGRVHESIARIHHLMGNLEAAVAEQRREVEISSESYGPRLTLGDLLLLAGDPTGAIEAYEKALELRPWERQAIERLAQAQALAARRASAPDAP